MAEYEKNHETINYVEFPAKDMAATQAFFAAVFGWTFTAYGDEYVAFHGAGIDGGFFHSDQHSSTANGSALLVFISDDLEATQDKVTAAQGEIIKAIFSFPGGRRFHFTDPNGNEFAVWSEKQVDGGSVV